METRLCEKSQPVTPKGLVSERQARFFKPSDLGAQLQDRGIF
jgi:hypothetical protein